MIPFFHQTTKYSMTSEQKSQALEAIKKARYRHRIAGLYRLPPITFDQAKSDELGRKACAQIMLVGSLDKIVVPSQDEWIGLNLLERDDER